MLANQTPFERRLAYIDHRVVQHPLLVQELRHRRLGLAAVAGDLKMAVGHRRGQQGGISFKVTSRLFRYPSASPAP